MVVVLGRPSLPLEHPLLPLALLVEAAGLLWTSSRWMDTTTRSKSSAEIFSDLWREKRSVSRGRGWYLHPLLPGQLFILLVQVVVVMELLLVAGIPMQPWRSEEGSGESEVARG